MKQFTSFGWVDEETRTANLQGLVVSTNRPATGVFALHDMEHIDEDDMRGRCLAWEEHRRVCFRQDHDTCAPGGEYSPTLIGYRPRRHRHEEAHFEVGSGSRKCGFVPDEKAEYSAIVRESVLQVTRSRWVIDGAACSPCYPGQVDGDTEGPFLAYAPPPDVFGEYGNQEVKARIRRV